VPEAHQSARIDSISVSGAFASCTCRASPITSVVAFACSFLLTMMPLISGNVTAALGYTSVSAATEGTLNVAAEANVGAQGIASGNTINLSTGALEVD
jgi:hypothetical protein